MKTEQGPYTGFHRRRFQTGFATLMISAFILTTSALRGQAVITSSNGWTATITLTPIDAIPSTTNCPWFYHYEVQYNYTVTFSGSATNRSVSANVYFNCTGGTGGQPYNFLGTFTGNSSGTLTTSNNARQYNSSGAYNYGANPSCTTIALSDVGCSSATLSYWGNGVSNGSTNISTGSTLPVELTSFRAEDASHYGSSQVRVFWSTATETNNAFFTVESSVDGHTWSPAARVEGSGTLTEPRDYEVYIDQEASLMYFRLTQTDFDGASKTYTPIAWEAQAPSIRETSVYPNPASDHITVETADEGAVQLVDLMGNVLWEAHGHTHYTIDVGDWDRGCYLLIEHQRSGTRPLTILLH